MAHFADLRDIAAANLSQRQQVVARFREDGVSSPPPPDSMPGCSVGSDGPFFSLWWLLLLRLGRILVPLGRRSLVLPSTPNVMETGSDELILSVFKTNVLCYTPDEEVRVTETMRGGGASVTGRYNKSPSTHDASLQPQTP